MIQAISCDIVYVCHAVCVSHSMCEPTTFLAFFDILAEFMESFIRLKNANKNKFWSLIPCYEMWELDWNL